MRMGDDGDTSCGHTGRREVAQDLDDAGRTREAELLGL
jgi:hypothetical protein